MAGIQSSAYLTIELSVYLNNQFFRLTFPNGINYDDAMKGVSELQIQLGKLRDASAEAEAKAAEEAAQAAQSAGVAENAE